MKYKDPDWLKEQYIKLNKNSYIIANELGVSRSTISNYLRKFKINKKEIKKYEDKEWLYYQYIVLDKTAKEIAKEIDCSSFPILKKIKDFDLKKDIPKYQDEDWLRKQYLELGKSAEDIAQELSVSSHPILSFLRKYNIKRNDTQIKIAKDLLLKKTRFNRILSGNFQIKGKCFNQLVEETGIPYSTLFRNKNILNDENIDFFISGYNKAISSLEMFIEKELQLTRFNKKISNSDLLYRPDFKLSNDLYLNVDGLYWHSERKYSHHISYHYDMYVDYKNNNLQILQFREDEVKEKFKIIKSIIDLRCQNTLNFHANECEIKNVNLIDAKPFLKENHLMGSCKGLKHLGLFYQNKLIALLSFKIKNKKLMIKRFCFKCGFFIIDGFSKLINYLENKFYLKKIMIWVNLRYDDDTFLIKNGFQQKKDILGWCWTNGTKVYPRFKCRTNMDERRLLEREYATELKWFKIYDAGQRFLMKEI